MTDEEIKSKTEQVLIENQNSALRLLVMLITFNCQS